jgi:Dolichyl-phosphate-mannose-protein mannosyltransferase
MDGSTTPAGSAQCALTADGSACRGQKYGWSLALVLLLAFALRCGMAVIVERQVALSPGRICLFPDADGYWELAQRIVAGQDYSIYDPPRFVLRMPGFSLLLAGSQLVFDESTFAARCLLAGVGTWACGLTYLLGRELCGHSVALLAALYTALSPTLVFFSETAFAATLLVSLITIARMARSADGSVSMRRYTVAALFAGVWIAIATYMRPTWLYVGPMIAVVVLFSVRGTSVSRSKWLAFGWLVVGVALSMAPWVARNYLVTGHIVPTTLWVGPSLYDGLHPGATGDSDMIFYEKDQLMATMSEYEMDREYRRRAMNFMWENPVRAIGLALEKQRRYWNLIPNAAQFRDSTLKVAIVLLAMLPLLGFASYGAWLSRRDLPLLALTAGALVLFAGLHLLFVGSLRYRLPAEYPLAVLAAVGVKSLCWRERCVLSE